ncbi:hypothetical protein B6D29_00605 [Microgenomates bacterium UTCPR1]|nr:hypothetical protein [Patescibacteria group bacterium]OQY68541.1 MAG: hypothetical protein B6D29_00605 [Microgenomates bacterium UTCPR1]
MDQRLKPLKDRSLLVVFAYAPAGLGHLRVTDALYHGLPKDANTPLLLGSQDQTITYLHRLMSLNPVISRLADWIESNIFIEEISTAIYRRILEANTDILYRQMLTIVDEVYETPSKILVVATHFGLAHQLAAIKKRLEKEKNIRMILTVQVTDDSPFRIWVVPEADLIVVPSEATKNNLDQFIKKMGYRVPTVVNPYPISPTLTKTLSENELKEKFDQVDPNKDTKTKIIIPVSGAAVQTDFLTNIIGKLHGKSNRFVFHIVVKNAPFTRNFISKMASLDFVHLSIGATDRKMIDNYEYVYNQNTISLEITKPSEQAFKALIDPSKKSASILLFSKPVGRQEKDNLNFLRRHQLIPSYQDEELLWTMTEDEKIFSKARSWRGLCLPFHSSRAADFIFWCLKTGLFSKMLQFDKKREANKKELGSDGVVGYWQLVADLIK